MIKKLFNNSIVNKMFIITFLSMMSIVTIIFFFQSLYLGKYYTEQKINGLVSNINSITDDYVKKGWNYEELARELKKFRDANNATMDIIYDEFDQTSMYDDWQSEKEFLVTIELNNKYYDIYMTDEILLKAFNNRMPNEQSPIQIKGIKLDEEILTPISINDYVIEDIIDHQDLEIIEGRGVLISYSLVSEQLFNFDDSVNNVISSYGIDYYSTFENERNGVKYTITDLPFVGYQQIEFAKVIKIDGKELVFSITASLQPVSEVIKVLNKYFILFYLISAIISLIIAGLYSGLISKPVLKLTKAADKMANMDFDLKLNEDRDDELGDLSKSLNSLSHNLNTALCELKSANDQLKFDIEKEKKQEHIRKEFVANISHELKTPLGVIKGFAEGIRDGVKVEKREYYMQVILDEIEKMNKLIMDMLELSKIEHNNLNKVEVFDLRPIVDKLKGTFEVGLDDKNLTLDIQGQFKRVKGVKFNIAQVFTNLVSNAIKHSYSDSDIIIRGYVEDNKNYITISNRGENIAEEDLERVWLRFYKGDKSHNRDEGGTGLGLAIVKAILDKHKSEFGLRNIGDRVEFYFSLDTE